MKVERFGVCPECGTSFDRGVRQQRRYCSDRCKWTNNNRNRTLKPNAIYDCATCGKHVERWVAPSEQAKHPPRYCSRACKGKGMSGADHPMWRGGRVVESDGYIKIYAPDHPDANKKGYVWEHRLIAEQLIGRPLAPEEVVHHEDDDPGHNAFRNIRVFPSQAEHKRFHEARRQRDGDGRYMPRSA